VKEAQSTPTVTNLDLLALPTRSHTCNADAAGFRDAAVPGVQAAA